MAGSFSDPRDRSFIADSNTPLQKDLEADYAALGAILHRRGLDIDVHARRLGGFHFNDSKYGDDDLDTGSIDPYRLFLIFNELVDAQWRQVPDFQPAHMLDQSHNVTDPIESLMTSAIELQRATRRRWPTISRKTMR